MSACEGIGSGVYFRACLLQAYYYGPRLDIYNIDAQLLPIIGVTDCKSVYNTIHREGTVKLPTERHLIFEICALKEMIFAEAGRHCETRSTNCH